MDRWTYNPNPGNMAPTPAVYPGGPPVPRQYLQPQPQYQPPPQMGGNMANFPVVIPGGPYTPPQQLQPRGNMENFPAVYPGGPPVPPQQLQPRGNMENFPTVRPGGPFVPPGQLQPRGDQMSVALATLLRRLQEGQRASGGGENAFEAFLRKLAPSLGGGRARGPRTQDY